jgi:hypothetical protein
LVPCIVENLKSNLWSSLFFQNVTFHGFQVYLEFMG